MTDFNLTRDERTDDRSGTPNGLMVQAQKNDNIHYTDKIDDELNVLVDFVVGEATVKKTGYKRFVRYRKKVNGKEYGAVKQPKQ